MALFSESASALNGIERLMMFACGRRMEALDRPALDAILAATTDDNYRFRDLIEQIVLSAPFQNN